MDHSQNLPPTPGALSTSRQEEFIRLLNGAHALLLRYIMSLVGNRHDAEDVLQRTGLVMWRRFETYESGTDFIAWATTVAFYETRNFLRAAGRSRVKFDDQLLEILAAERALDVRRWDTRLDALDSCVEKLAPAGRQIVEAVYSEGVGITELARRQGLAVQTLYNKLNQIRRALAECVERRLSEAAT